MRYRTRMRRRGIVVAAVLIWLQALAPLLAAARASAAIADGSATVAICSAGGLKLVRIDHATPASDEPAPAPGFCPDCIVCPGIGGIASPALAAPTPVLILPSASEAPAGPVTLLRAEQHHGQSPPPSRAPPLV